jgi:hypothetical protein
MSSVNGRSSIQIHILSPCRNELPLLPVITSERITVAPRNLWRFQKSRARAWIPRELVHDTIGVHSLVRVVALEGGLP